MQTALAAVFVALLACAQPAAGGNLADVLSGEWVVSRWSANEFERSVAAEGERRQRLVEEHDAAQLRKKAGGGEDEGEEGEEAAPHSEEGLVRPVVLTGLLETNATATDGVLGGTLMLDSGYEVKVEAPRIKKAAVVTLTLPDDDVASLTFTLKPQPVGAHGVSLSRYTTKGGATGTAAAHFHSAGSIYVTLVPAEGSKGASQSFWLVRLAAEGSYWDSWCMCFPLPSVSD